MARTDRRSKGKRPKHHRKKPKILPFGCGPGVVLFSINEAVFAAGEMTQRAPSIELAHMQMKRVINVLEGPDGDNYDKNVGNPAGLGVAIIPYLRELDRAEKMPGAADAARIAEFARDVAVARLSTRTPSTTDEIKRTARAISLLVQATEEALGLSE